MLYVGCSLRGRNAIRRREGDPKSSRMGPYYSGQMLLMFKKQIWLVVLRPDYCVTPDLEEEVNAVLFERACHPHLPLLWTGCQPCE
jgi:hypothetical protein